ncbi:unnamed protein product, partial [Prorocentrum cordatum]
MLAEERRSEAKQCHVAAARPRLPPEGGARELLVALTPGAGVLRRPGARQRAGEPPGARQRARLLADAVQGRPRWPRRRRHGRRPRRQLGAAGSRMAGSAGGGGGAGPRAARPGGGGAAVPWAALCGGGLLVDGVDGVGVARQPPAVAVQGVLRLHRSQGRWRLRLADGLRRLRRHAWAAAAAGARPAGPATSRSPAASADVAAEAILAEASGGRPAGSPAGSAASRPRRPRQGARGPCVAQWSSSAHPGTRWAKTISGVPRAAPGSRGRSRRPACKRTPRPRRRRRGRRSPTGPWRGRQSEGWREKEFE